MARGETRLPGDRLTYLVYRCERCRRLLTCIDIQETWEAAEASGVMARGLCPCGSGRVVPANPHLLEEIFLPRVWRVWWHRIFLPWYRAHRGVGGA